VAPTPPETQTSSPTVCPSEERELILFPAKQNWTWHYDNAIAVGCFFGSINNAEEQLTAERLIVAEFGASGSDFVWFGALRIDGEKPPVGQSPPGGFNSTWSWVDGSGMFGAGPSQNSGGYQNWTENEPNNNSDEFGGWGSYAGINTAAVSPLTDVFGWGDMGPGMKWYALYKCCPTDEPAPTPPPDTTEDTPVPTAAPIPPETYDTPAPTVVSLIPPTPTVSPGAPILAPTTAPVPVPVDPTPTMVPVAPVPAPTVLRSHLT